MGDPWWRAKVPSIGSRRALVNRLKRPTDYVRNFPEAEHLELG
jgi:hypothetical protein